MSFVSEDIPLESLNVISSEDAKMVDLTVLKKYNLVRNTTKFVKIYLKGSIQNAMVICGINVTKGSLQQIEKSGGKVE